MNEESGEAEAPKKERKKRAASKYIGWTKTPCAEQISMGWEPTYFGKSPKDIKAQVKDENEIVWIVRDHDKFQAIVQKTFTFEKIK